MYLPETFLPVATVFLMLLQWGSLLEAEVPNELQDCAPRELRCEILCHLVELELQCAKCRSRAPVRFGKRKRDNFLPAPRDPSPLLNALSHSTGLSPPPIGKQLLCCDDFLSLLLHNSKIPLRNK
ncbi:uncharacterized protein [Periplaneta americana]|uniref:uncharacterized protein n=1 Tax=Periplaneta americana TaxID=6978 RepID=UPI0037E7C77E